MTSPTERRRQNRMDGYNGREGASNGRETACSHGNIKGARDGENYKKNEVMVKKKKERCTYRAERSTHQEDMGEFGR